MIRPACPAQHRGDGAGDALWRLGIAGCTRIGGGVEGGVGGGVGGSGGGVGGSGGGVGLAPRC